MHANYQIKFLERSPPTAMAQMADGHGAQTVLENLHGIEVDGDPEIMLRMLVEEYARMGCGLDELMDLCRQPFYVGFHGLLQFYGEAELARRVRDILSRCGVFRVATRETTPLSEQLVQLDVSRLRGTHGEVPGS